MRKRFILAITGASGALHAVQFAKLLSGERIELHGIISGAGEEVLRLELGMVREEIPNIAAWHDVDDFTAPMASGSSRFEAMVVLPCTMGTLAAVANGITRNLIHRSADVMLKEKRRLVLAVRETPLGRVHLTNMLAAHDAGAIICPIMPAFYHHPRNIEDMALQFAARVADLLGIDAKGIRRWGSETMKAD